MDFFPELSFWRVLSETYVQCTTDSFTGIICYYRDCYFYATTENPSSNVFDNSGSEALFERTKARGFEAFMQRFTAVLVFFWLAIALALAILSSK